MKVLSFLQRTAINWCFSAYGIIMTLGKRNSVISTVADMYWYRQRQNKRGRRKLARTVKDALEGGAEVCRAVKNVFARRYGVAALPGSRRQTCVKWSFAGGMSVLRRRCPLQSESGFYFSICLNSRSEFSIICKYLYFESLYLYFFPECCRNL